MTLLRLRSVTRYFGSFRACDDVSFAIDPGEVVGLLGANGAGKTTVMRQALGLLVPSGGEVTHFGTTPSRDTRARIGYVPQGLGLWADLSGRENLRFVDRAYGSAPEHPGLEPDAMGGTVGNMPLGRQRRLAFAAALGHEPELLVLDEPTSGVDVLERSRLWDTIRARAESGTGVLVSTHFMDEARQCDRLLVMDRGRIVVAGTAHEIVGNQQVVQVDGADWALVFGSLDSAGFDCALAGTSVRVLGSDVASVREALGRLGIRAAVEECEATLEEAMVALSRP